MDPRSSGSRRWVRVRPGTSLSLCPRPLRCALWGRETRRRSVEPHFHCVHGIHLWRDGWQAVTGSGHAFACSAFAAPLQPARDDFADDDFVDKAMRMERKKCDDRSFLASERLWHRLAPRRSEGRSRRTRPLDASGGTAPHGAPRLSARRISVDARASWARKETGRLLDGALRRLSPGISGTAALETDPPSEGESRIGCGRVPRARRLPRMRNPFSRLRCRATANHASGNRVRPEFQARFPSEPALGFGLARGDGNPG